MKSLEFHVLASVAMSVKQGETYMQWFVKSPQRIALAYGETYTSNHLEKELHKLIVRGEDKVLTLVRRLREIPTSNPIPRQTCTLAASFKGNKMADTRLAMKKFVGKGGLKDNRMVMQGPKDRSR